jgi:hypothetical protein
MKKVRKQIYLEKRQDQQLKRIAEARGISEAEVIRQAVDQITVLSAQLPVEIDDMAFEAFKREALARRKLGITGEPYKWRRQDAYEEREEKLDKQRSSRTNA